MCRKISLLFNYWKCFRDGIQSPEAVDALQFLWGINLSESDGCVILFFQLLILESRGGGALNPVRRLVLSQTITGFTPPSQESGERPLNLAGESCRRFSSYLWTLLIRLLQVFFFLHMVEPNEPVRSYWSLACDTIMFDRPVFAFVTCRGLENATQTCHRDSTSVAGVSGSFSTFQSKPCWGAGKVLVCVVSIYVRMLGFFSLLTAGCSTNRSSGILKSP